MKRLRWLDPSGCLLSLLVSALLLVLAGALLWWWPWPPPEAQPTAAVTRIPLPTVTPTPPFTPTPAAPTTTPTPVAPPPPGPGEIAIGQFVQIRGTGGDGLRLRSAPSLQAPVRFLGQEAEVFRVTDGPRQADGYTWWYLETPYDATRSGWAVANYLSPLPASPTP